MKKASVLLGSPRKNGNTNQLVKYFISDLEDDGHQYRCFSLYDMDLKPCLSCRACQKNQIVFGCTQKDDMQTLFDSIMTSDLLVLATPIYSWYCTPPMKSVLDRMVFGMNKYYSTEEPRALWQGKSVAIITTCGYRIEKGADLFEEAIKRYCKHSKLNYLGMLAERHMGYDTVFMDKEKEEHVHEFASRVMKDM